MLSLGRIGLKKSLKNSLRKMYNNKTNRLPGFDPAGGSFKKERKKENGTVSQLGSG